MAASAIRCPTCRGETPAGAPFRPFCSERCKMVDLGRWFQGEYVVAGEDAIALDPEEFETHLRHLEEAQAQKATDEGDDPDPDA